jgi:hypothetical protein
MFKVIVVVVYGDILKSIALMLRVNKLLIMAKDTGAFRPIAMGEVFL